MLTKSKMLVASILLIAGLSVPSFGNAENAEPELELKRTTVYYGGTKTATGKTPRVGYIAYAPEYFGKTCILYTQDMQYIGIYECEDTGGKYVRSGERIDVYCNSLQDCYDWVEQNGEYCYIQWIESEG